jgi:phosphoglycerate dehydrogenase-like enzyme
LVSGGGPEIATFVELGGNVDGIVWVPPEALGYFAGLAAECQVAAFPPDPLASSVLARVRFVVPPQHVPSAPLARELRPLWSKLPSLDVLQTVSSGVDWIIQDIPPYVTLCSAKGVLDEAVAEWVVGAILADLKLIQFYRDEQTARRWTRRPVGSLQGSSVLLVGYGSIAREVERRLVPFGPSIARVARTARPGVAGRDALLSLLPDADIVVLLLPHTVETRGLVNHAFLNQMRPGALLVNGARGALVDGTALLAALRCGRLRAVLDVTDPEPLPEDDPLWTAPGMLLTPHVAAYVSDWMTKTYGFVAQQVLRWRRGEPLANVVVHGGAPGTTENSSDTHPAGPLG